MADGELIITWSEALQPGERTYLTPLTEDQAEAAIEALVPAAVADAIANDATIIDAAENAVADALTTAGGIGTEQVKGKAITTAKLKFADTGKNLLDPKAITQGVTLSSNGGTIASALLSVSGYIPVTPGQQITMSCTDSANLGPRSHAFYTPALGFISWADNPTYATVTVTVPAGAAFLRCAYRLTSIPSAQVEVGGAKTPFEPFFMLLPTARITPENLGPGSIGATSLAQGAVTAGKTSFLVPGKNLFDPAQSVAGVYVSEATGTLVALAGFVTSAHIPVTEGVAYSFSPSRKIAWYNAAGTFLLGSNHVDESNPHTVTAPAGATTVRFSYRNSATAQAEVGAPTAWEAYRLTMPALALTAAQTGQASGAVTLTRTGTALAIASTLADGSGLVINADTDGSANGGFNFVSTTHNGATIHANTDDIAPIRTTTATVGANHGWTCIGRYTVTGHGKTTADLGSQWTDGTRTYVLIMIDGDNLTVGGSYTTNGDGSTYTAAVNPTGDLTHVSGATDTAAIPIASRVAGAQLYPSIKDVAVAVTVDGTPAGEGTQGGLSVQVRESYDILDYAALHDWAIAHVGQDWRDNLAAIEGIVRVSNVYEFQPAGRCLVATTLQAIRQTALGACGVTQAVALTAGSGQTVTRYLPGVKTKSGVDLSEPTDLDGWATTLIYEPADYDDADMPPIRCVDWINAGGAKVVGFALGILPKLDGDDPARAALPAGWEVRSTKKSYPTAVGPAALAPGDTLSVEAYRTYLSPPPAGLSAADQITDGQATWIHADRHTAGTTAVPAGDVGAPVTVTRTQGATTTDTHVTAAGVHVSGVGTTTLTI
ncbi:hypothetical protein ACQCX2_17540 [Propionibacteriaceae bacterium Y1700]|uniref:hypothetical protein n=1 Tax=Microlunatus sp. Y1700 TaxID=3418487 RepID=UPI003DA74FDF